MRNNQQVDIPLLFFFFAFVLILFGLLSKLIFQNNTSALSEKRNDTISQLPQKNEGSLKKLDYSLPVLCNYHTKDASISAAMNGNLISAIVMYKNETQNRIVQADCLYSWNGTEKKGVKKCGVGQYITLGKQLLGAGLISTSSLNSLTKQIGKEIPVDVGKLFLSCSNVKEIKKELFILPKNVRFEGK